MFAFRGAPVVVLLRMTAEGTARDGASEDSFSEPCSGDLDLTAPLPFALGLRNGEAVRLMTGGVCIRGGGLLGRFIDGLSQDEKKSSPPSDGVGVPSVDVATTTSVMTTSPG